MSTRAGSKQGKPAGRSTTKTSGKDLSKTDKQPPSVIEIVPGKFNESDWISLLENDDTEDFIADIFESIWTETSKQIQQIHIRKQLLPFTLMMTENALSNVIQWAFLERDEPKPSSGNFWTEDTEPIPCIMDNWGEGVVPACREERPQSMRESSFSMADRPVTAPVSIPILEAIDQIRRPSTGSSVGSSIRTSHSNSRAKKLSKINESIDIEQHIKLDPWTNTDSNDNILTQKESSTEYDTNRSSFEQKHYNHDVLVIQTQPPKLEPLAELFQPPRMTTKSSSTQSIPLISSTKRRNINQSKLSSQFGSDAVASTTNMSETTTTKSHKKPSESKIYDDQQIEEVISKAPVATHAMLKSILSRPPGYRELDLDEYGNVIAIAKLDPDKIASKNIRVKCDLVKPRKPAMEIRPPPTKTPQQIKTDRSASKYASVKIVLPEQSTEVGDLIQPVAGVLYEDSRLKKGDPGQYQSGTAKFTNYYDENNPLKPIAQRSNLALIQVANDLLQKSKENNNNNNDDDDNNDRDSQIPKLHRLARIPPIMSGSGTTSA
ncbi:unnamed protein product [Adineta steineri]|uniref:Uncharacterized protein n=1 Tax=Adineta steineri TaxID=433720 RepID=A0A815X2S6_9BILA|nr:unnamed protein product [Adineta steineri]CAF1661293.1 unnamed protein product [Adineta steineri]